MRINPEGGFEAAVVRASNQPSLALERICDRVRDIDVSRVRLELQNTHARAAIIYTDMAEPRLLTGRDTTHLCSVQIRRVTSRNNAYA